MTVPGALRSTIRVRLTVAATAVTIVMLGVASVTVVAIQRRALTEGIDESIEQTADNLGPLREVPEAFDPVGDPEDTFVQVLDTDGRVLAATDAVARDPVLDVTPDGIGPGFGTERLVRPPGRFRVLVRRIDTDAGPAFLVVGRNLDDVDESVRSLVTSLAVVAPVCILVLGGLSWWLVGRTLRPVDDIRREVEAIGGADLHRRVPVPGTDDEIATLARTMNAMLARVQAAGEEQQRFVDDASHELRTPLTRMIADLDVALAHPGADDPVRTLRRVHEDATEVEGLVEDLLFLARTAQGRSVPDVEVDLDDVVLDVVAATRSTADIAVDTRGVGAAVTRGDGRALRRAVGNVVANAVRHARAEVAISVRSEAGWAVLVVDDDGPGIPTADRERIFERFTRLDEARGRADGGSGLGLAIADDVVRRHGGTISVSSSASGGARLTISLPAG